MNEHSAIFGISVAAELAGMHPQTLRQYDRLGLVSPSRTSGKSRRYSMHDVVQLREVARFSAEGVSLEGIKRVLDLENQVVTLTKRVHELEAALADELSATPRPPRVRGRLRGRRHLAQGRHPRAAFDAARGLAAARAE